MADKKTQTYEEFLKATGQKDSEAAKRSFGSASMAQAGAGVTPPVAPKTEKPQAPAIPKNPLQSTAEQLLGRPVESQAEMANRLGWPNSPDTAKRYNAAIQAMIDARNSDTAAQHRAGAYIGQNAEQAGPAKPTVSAPVVEAVAPAMPIESVPIPPVADKPAEVVTEMGPKQEDRDKMAWLGKTLAGLAGGLGDAFSARAAALQGRDFTPSQTMQREAIEAQTKEGAANRAQAAKLHAESLMAQQELARLNNKAALTAAEVDRKASMERLLLENKARLEAAGLQAGIIPEALRSTMPTKDPLGVR